jgi:Gluconate 2-dehydrogenase subunit 3
MRLTRRSLLKGAGALVGVGIVGGGIVWRWIGTPDLADLSSWRGFTPDDVTLLNEIADAIIPATDTPGAGSAKVGPFIAAAVTECFEPLHQAAFVAGLRRIGSTCRERFGRSFGELSADDRLALLTAIETDRRRRELWNRGQRGLRLLARPFVGIGPPINQVPHYFTMLKELTVRGYFTSEVGATQALRHMAVPGAYDGALPYRKGDRGWSM